MKTISISSMIFLLFVSAISIFAQTNDPLANFKPELRSEEIVAFYDWQKSQVFDYIYYHGEGAKLDSFPAIVRPDSIGRYLPSYSRYLFMDITTGNFIGTSQDEVVAAWVAPNSSVILVISKVDPHNKEWLDIHVSRSDTGEVINDDQIYEIATIRLVAGNFDQDPQEEFILAYLAADTTIKMTLYDTDDMGNFESKAVISDQKLSFTVKTWKDEKAYMWFDLAAEDFNNDGIDEVVLVGDEKENESGWNIFVKIYEVDSTTPEFIPQVKGVAFHSTESQSELQVPVLNRLIVTTGKFSNTSNNEGVIGFYNFDSTNCYASQQKITGYLIRFQVSQNLTSLSFAEKDTFVYKDYGKTFYHISPFNLVSGDLNNDGLDEILVIQKDLVTGTGCLKIYRVDSLLHFTEIFEKPLVQFLPCHKHVAKIANVDFDSTSGNFLKKEIILLDKGDSEYSKICVYEAEWDSTGGITGLKLKAKKDISESLRKTRITTGDFDGEDVYLGKPRRYSKTEVLQPLVILNAPPVHYDIFDGVAYDVSKSYPPNEPMFYTAYSKDLTQVAGFETTISQNWSRSIGVSAGLSGWGIGLDMSMTHRYGENFSKVTGSSRSIKTSVYITACVDDYIYATTVDYDFWEYPAYIGSELIGYILVTVPIRIEHTWFPSKLPSANDWVPNHEVGNILSYQEYPELNNNAEVAALIKGTYDDSFVLHGESNPDWSVTFQDFSDSKTSTTKTIHMDYSASIGFWGIGASFSGSYDEEDTYTHQTTVSQDHNAKVK